MSKSSSVSLAPLAALLLAGSALAQTINPSGVDANRADRRCTSAPLSTDAATPCSDDVVNDRPGVLPVVVRAPDNNTAGTATTGTGTGTSTQPAPSTGTMGVPSRGMVNSGSPSTQGATGSGTVSTGSTAGAPARR